MQKYYLDENDVEECGEIVTKRVVYTQEFLNSIKNKKVRSNLENSRAYIESYNNLSQDGLCVVYGDTRMYDDSRVSENAQVYGLSRIFGHTDIKEDAKISNSLVMNSTITFEASNETLLGVDHPLNDSDYEPASNKRWTYWINKLNKKLQELGTILYSKSCAWYYNPVSPAPFIQRVNLEGYRHTYVMFYEGLLLFSNKIFHSYYDDSVINLPENEDYLVEFYGFNRNACKAFLDPNIGCDSLNKYKDIIIIDDGWEDIGSPVYEYILKRIFK